MVFTILVGLLGSARPAHAQAQAQYADLDRDGVRDVIQHNGTWNSVVHVWLSKTASTRQLHTRQPLIWVRVVDLDGDGRLDLVGADKSTRVHVWHYRGGRLRPARSAPSHSRASSGSSGSVATDPGLDEIACLVRGTDPPPCHAPRLPGVAVLSGLSRLVPISLGHPASSTVVLPPSRAPPTCR